MKTITMTIKSDYLGRPNKMHLDAQMRYPHRVQRDRTKYTRKVKHKGAMAY